MWTASPSFWDWNRPHFITVQLGMEFVGRHRPRSSRRFTLPLSNVGGFNRTFCQRFDWFLLLPMSANFKGLR